MTPPRGPLRIVHLETGRHLYGGAAQVLYLLDGLRERGVEGVLVTPPGSELEAAARARGLAVHPIPLAGEADLRFIPRLARFLRAQRPDLLHAHSRRGADLLGGVAAAWAGVPAVLSRRVDHPEPAWSALPKYRLFRRVIAISERIREEVLRTGLAPERVVCVRSAVEVERWAVPCDRARWEGMLAAISPPPGPEGAPGPSPLLGVAAQLIERKGHRDLIAALPAVVGAFPGIRVVFFGRGPLEGALRSEVERVGLGSRVLFAGFVQGLEGLLPCLDVLVHPAHAEGLGVILLQASAAGVPIVAARGGGIPEVVRDGVNGLLVPPGQPAALGAALLRLLGDRELANRLSEGGRSLSRSEFSVDSMVEGNLAVYRDTLGQDSW